MYAQISSYLVSYSFQCYLHAQIWCHLLIVTKIPLLGHFFEKNKDIKKTSHVSSQRSFHPFLIFCSFSQNSGSQIASAYLFIVCTLLSVYLSIYLSIHPFFFSSFSSSIIIIMVNLLIERLKYTIPNYTLTE